MPPPSLLHAALHCHMTIKSSDLSVLLWAWGAWMVLGSHTIKCLTQALRLQYSQWLNCCAFQPNSHNMNLATCFMAPLVGRGAARSLYSHNQDGIHLDPPLMCQPILKSWMCLHLATDQYKVDEFAFQLNINYNAAFYMFHDGDIDAGSLKHARAFQVSTHRHIRN